MTLENYTFEAPAYFASALINGDCSGMSDEEQVEFDRWIETHPNQARDVVGCELESYIGRWNGLQTELLTYTALRHC